MFYLRIYIVLYYVCIIHRIKLQQTSILFFLDRCELLCQVFLMSIIYYLQKFSLVLDFLCLSQRKCLNVLTLFQILSNKF